MGFLDNVLGSAVPGGNYSKPLMIALMALLASGALARAKLGSSTKRGPLHKPC
jgi:hypothetical protein